MKRMARWHWRDRRRRSIPRAVILFLIVILIASMGAVFIGWRTRMGNEKAALLRLWDEGSYKETFELSAAQLEAAPLDYLLLTLNGFAAYQLAIAQINSFDTQVYVDQCVWALRKALLLREGRRDGRVRYVLGKAYYYKGAEYADLSVKYLEEARDLGYGGKDIPEYLGLAYAAIHDYRSSVAAFTQALTVPEPGAAEAESHEADLLLLNIAQSYIALEEPEAAKAYLQRCMDSSRDSETVPTARLLLGGVLKEAGEREKAEAQYLAIIQEGGENAEAHYQLGELYAATDPTRARAEWRRAVRLDPTHRGARSRLNM